jgi:hypothetical protein
MADGLAGHQHGLETGGVRHRVVKLEVVGARDAEDVADVLVEQRLDNQLRPPDLHCRSSSPAFVRMLSAARSASAAASGTIRRATTSSSFTFPGSSEVTGRL